jgi:GNAT superfamily N-acetyltransferase
MIIRDAIWPDDRAAATSFIDKLQAYEHAFEPNRRIDTRVGAEYFEVMMTAVRDRGGIVRVAEAGGRAVGWAVAWPDNDELYVEAGRRRHLYISELFVEEGMRGSGVGKALIAACEDFARAQGLKIVRIGVLADNHRAKAVYLGAGFKPYALRLTKHLD